MIINIVKRELRYFFDVVVMVLFLPVIILVLGLFRNEPEMKRQL